MAIGYKQRGNVVNYYENGGNQTLNKSLGNWRTLVFTNDGSIDMYLIVNSMRIKIKADETFDDDFIDFNSVEIQASENYRIWLRE